MRARRAAALAAVAAALLAASGCGSSDQPSLETQVRDSLALVSGLPQQGPRLGQADAPVTLTVFADPTDPRFTVFEEQVLPDLVHERVHSGRLALRLRPIVPAAPADDDAPVAARAIQAATQQSRAWQFAGVFAVSYLQFLDRETLAGFLGEVRGLDVHRALVASDSARVRRALAASEADAGSLGANGGLALAVSAAGVPQRLIRPGVLTSDAVLTAIRRATAGVPATPPAHVPPRRAPRRQRTPAHGPPAQPAPGGTAPDFAGVPQSGFALGSRRAHARLAVFADLTSPAYATFDRRVLPELITRYVRPGRVLLQLRTVSAPPGRPFAERVARVGQAAGLQNRLWQLADAAATSTAHRITAGNLGRTLASVPGLDAARARTDASDSRIRSNVALSERRAREAGVSDTLGFTLKPSSGPRQTIRTPADQPRRFLAEVGRILGG